MSLEGQDCDRGTCDGETTQAKAQNNQCTCEAGGGVDEGLGKSSVVVRERAGKVKGGPITDDCVCQGDDVLI